jgi:hypothetical protein
LFFWTISRTIHDVAWLQERHDWPGLRGVVMVESTREIGDKIERETRVIDMIFRDDECRIRTDHAPSSFTKLKHIAQNLIRKGPGNVSLRLKRKVGA